MIVFHPFRHRFLRAGMVALSAFFSIQAKAQFTTGNITLLQAGDGASALANTGNPIVLKEFSPAGVLTYSMAVPSATTGALLISGSASSEGFLSLSGDNRYLVFGGYATSLPNTTALSGATAASIHRGIGLAGGAGLSSYSLIATSASFFTGANIRGAAATNKNNCWGAGGNQGANYFGTASAPVTVQNTKTNLRAIAVFNNQLYCSSQVASGTPTDVGIYAIGAGTPTTNGQQVTTVINTGSGSQPAQFYFNTTGTICYVADQRSAANGGGIQKWTLAAGTWSLAYTLPTGTTGVGATGVIADFSTALPKVYATSNEANTNRLVCILDNGAASTASTLATATAANTVFKGLAFSPCNPPHGVGSASTLSACANQTLALNAAVAGSAPLSYYWSGPGLFANPNASTTIATATASGAFSLVAANSCGSDTSTVFVTVNPLPAISAHSVIVCTGQPATLTANGAASYSWNTGSTSPSLVITPTASTVYTVTGTSLNGCIKTITTQVATATTPSLTVSSGSLCAGDTLILTAGGANTYTWSNGASAYSIAVAPATNSTYAVTGGLAGCAGTDSKTSSVSVAPAPSVNISGSSVTCSGISILLSASGADTYSWNTGAASATIIVSPLVTTAYSVTGTASNGCKAIATTTISIVNGPALNIVASPPYLCYGASTSATLLVSGAATYTWHGGITGATLPVNQTQTSSYTVTGSIGANCSTTSQFQLQTLVCEGIEIVLQEQEIRLYPNPATDLLQVDVPDSKTISIHLVNILGQVVYAESGNGSHFSIPVTALPKGLYSLRLKLDGQTINKKIIIE